MTRAYLIVLLVLISGFAAFGDEAGRDVVSFGIGSQYPLNSEDVGDYMLLYLQIDAIYAHTFFGDSPFFNPGIGLVARVNPLSAVSPFFFGGLGLRLYNEFNLDGALLLAYVESDGYLYYYKPSSGSSIRSAHVDLSLGLVAVISPIELDIAFVFAPLVSDGLLSVYNSSVLRFVVNYRGVDN